LRKRIVALAAAALLISLFLTACAPDVFGDWVAEDGTRFSFSTNQVTMEGETYYYTAKNGEIKIQMTTDLFGSETSFVVDGTYVVRGNTMTLTLGKSTVYDLTRY
jgi:ABC-type glycerol-3-phosphate transport system substrate-binding protein